MLIALNVNEAINEWNILMVSVLILAVLVLGALVLFVIAMLKEKAAYFLRVRNWTGLKDAAMLNGDQDRDAVKTATIAAQVQEDESNEEAVLLLTADFQVLAANRPFFLLTGLHEIMSSPSSVESLASIFPQPSRLLAIKRLYRLLKLGEGDIEIEIEQLNGETLQLVWELHPIRQGQEIIMYYLTITKPPSGIQNPGLSELQYELQTGMRNDKQFALFMLSIEGLQAMLDDMNLSPVALLEQLKWELEMLESANLVYYAPLQRERLIVVLAGENVQEQVDEWAQEMIEAIHYTIYNCSPFHYVSVTIGIAVGQANECNAENLLKNAGAAINMIKHRRSSSYYVYSNLVV